MTRPTPAQPGGKASDSEKRASFWSERLGLQALRYPIPVAATTIR